jgi:hypothetical protein
VHFSIVIFLGCVIALATPYRQNRKNNIYTNQGVAINQRLQEDIYMRITLLISVMLLAVTTAQAEFLFERYGAPNEDGTQGEVVAIYDWHQDITWMKDAQFADSIGYKSESAGKLNYDEAEIFISTMNAFKTHSISNWRLPKMWDPITANGNGTFAYCGSDKGFNMDPDSGELAHMFHESLGLLAKFEPCTNTPQAGQGVTYSGPFFNINNNEKEAYIYGDVFAGTPAPNWCNEDPSPDNNAEVCPPEPAKVWGIHFEYGGQHADGQATRAPIWPVFDGDLLYRLGDPQPDYSRIDIDPSSATNEINPDSSGTVVVRIFGSPTLNAADIDPTTVRFGPYKAIPIDSGLLLDNDEDTYTDLTIQFNIAATGIQCGDTYAEIFGETTTAVNGIDTFIASDSIVTVDGIGCEGSSNDPDPAVAIVDIKPSSVENRLNPASGGTVLVRVYGSADIDLGSIDLNTLALGRNNAPYVDDLANSGTPKTVFLDGDEFLDLAVKFNMQDTGIACGDTKMDIYGETNGNELHGLSSFIGSDAIVTVNGQDEVCVGQAGQAVATIDIKPSATENRLNPASGGTILVRVYGSDTIDAGDINPDTVMFGRNNATPTDHRVFSDTNNDSYTDFTTKFNMQDTGIACGDTQVDMYGETTGLTFGFPSFVGSDAIVTVDGQDAVCEETSCHP